MPDRVSRCESSFSADKHWQGFLEIPSASRWFDVGPRLTLQLHGLTTVNGTISVATRDVLAGPVEMRAVVLGDQGHAYDTADAPLVVLQPIPSFYLLPAAKTGILASLAQLQLQIRSLNAPQRTRAVLTMTLWAAPRTARSAA